MNLSHHWQYMFGQLRGQNKHDLYFRVYTWGYSSNDCMGGRGRQPFFLKMGDGDVQKIFMCDGVMF